MRAVRHFLGAVILVFGSICLVEVVLGVRHAQNAMQHEAETVADLVVPSRTFFQELQPLAHVDTPVGPLVTNSFGLRGPEPVCPKPPGVYRVLVLGDEATIATHLSSDQTFCSQLQDNMLPGRTAIPVEVINGGQPQGCPLTLSLVYRQRLAALTPDAVVVVLSASDISDDLRARSFLQTDAAGNPLACPHPSLGGQEQPLDVWRSEFRLVDLAASKSLETWLDRGSKVRSDLLAPNRAGEWLASPTGVWSGPLSNALAPLVSLQSDVEARYAQFIVTAAPDISALDGGAAGWQTVGRFAKEAGITWIDPSDRIRVLPNAQILFAPDDTSDNDLRPINDIAATGPRDIAADACRVRLSADGHRLLAIELAMHFVAQPGLAAGSTNTERR